MLANEIIAQLASLTGAQPAAPVVPNIVININNGPAQSTPEVEVAQTDGETGADGMMIPPLQQKLELVKKMAGEESVYDPVCDDCGHSPCDCEPEEDQLSVIRRNAGLPIIVADEDEPYEG